MPRGNVNAKRDPKTGQFLKQKEPTSDPGTDPEKRTGQVSMKKRGRPPKQQKPTDNPAPTNPKDDKPDADYGPDMFMGSLIIEL